MHGRISMALALEHKFVRAITDFWAGDPGELSCTTNDLLRVLHKESRKTVFAENLMSKDRGNIPNYCVAPVDVPIISQNHILFFASKAYTSLESGDLAFEKGALIVAEHAVDENWWYGWSGSNRGVFPIQWVQELPVVQDVFPFNAVVVSALQPQLSGELSLCEGDTVTITGKADEGWYRGLSSAGVPGIFPEFCVRIVNGEAPESTKISGLHKVRPNNSDHLLLSEEKPQISEQTWTSQDTPLHGRALYDFHSSLPDELSFDAGATVIINKIIDDNWIEGQLFTGQRGMFPKNFVEILPVVSEGERSGNVMGAVAVPSDAVMEDFPPDTYAIVLREHISASEGELGLQEGDTVTILKKCGSDWIEAMDDYGNVGYCPTFCLEIVGSEPEEVRSSSRLDGSLSGSLDSFQSDRSGSSPTLSLDSFGRQTRAKDKRSSWHEDDTGQQSPRAIPKIRNPGLPHLPAGTKRNTIHVASPYLLDQSQRDKVIHEIITTEKDYIHSLEVCVAALRKDPPPDNFSLHTILEDVDNVLQAAKILLGELKGSKVDNGHVGECFLRNIPTLRRVYVIYCQENEPTIGLLCQYKDHPVFIAYMNRKVAEIRLKTNCFDLASMFIKPLQRVLKYPLLLQELLKATDSTHPDYVFVRESAKQMGEIASSINELKRRKELVAKYRDSKSTSFSERLSKLNFHSVVKKSSRLGLLVSSTIGFTTLIQDPAFQAAERRFQVTRRTIKWFLRNVTDFIEHLKTLIPSMTSIADDFSAVLKDSDGKQPALTYVTSQDAISKQIIHEFVPKIKVHVSHPLEETLNQFQGPINLISKRHSKLIDFENAKRKLDRIKDGQRTQTMLDEVELARKVYHALNSQLLDELPKFNEVTSNILRSRVEAFLHFRKLFFFACSSAILPCLASVPTKGRNLEKNLAHKIETVLNDLKKLDYGSSVPVPELERTSRDILIQRTVSKSDNSKSENAEVGFSAGQSDIKVCNNSPQRSGDDITLTKPSPTSATVTPPLPSLAVSNAQISGKYHSANDYHPKDVMEVSVCRGDKIEVIKEHDPMGSDQRWFVRVNGKTGFIPKSLLYPAEAKEIHRSVDPKFTHSSPPPAAKSAMSASLLLSPAPLVASFKSASAAFAFQPYGPHQLPLKLGDTVAVMAEHDLDGNAEWWYVQHSNGAQGYVPSAYLKDFV